MGLSALNVCTKLKCLALFYGVYLCRTTCIYYFVVGVYEVLVLSVSLEDYHELLSIYLFINPSFPIKIINCTIIFRQFEDES